ncbi:MAG: hypothetical protein JO126_03675 [Alphaproteobacteria bacterium]|nr:hypothetical protein [Alphaproteobacteria bacterium]MBV8548538.1 hypothetical protein [Alphaproteobacteria bacterium]
MVTVANTATDQLAEAAQALRVDPSNTRMWHKVGYLLLERGRWAEALPYLQQACAIDPLNRSFALHRALAEMETGALDQAAEQMIICLNGDVIDDETWLFTAEILCRAAQYEMARLCFERATRGTALRQSALLGYAYTTFLTGHFQDALQPLADSDAVTDDLDLPLWQGDASQTIILVGHYGFGDLIHYLRYVNELRSKLCTHGGDVVLRIPLALATLVARNLPDFTIYVHDTMGADHPARQLPNVVTSLPPQVAAKLFYLQALPHLGTFHTNSGSAPYLRADPILRDKWWHKTASIRDPRIGLVWAGNPLHRNDHNRSVPPQSLQPLVEVAGAHLISLQRGGDAAALGILDAAPDIADFADSAALMETLDLLITVDSAPTHLGGALNIPTWVMLPFDHDWRWLMERTDCIWYPSLRLYRQTTPQDWPGIIGQIAADLTKLLAGDRCVLQVQQNPLMPNLSQHPQAMNNPAISALLQQVAAALRL